MFVTCCSYGMGVDENNLINNIIDVRAYILFAVLSIDMDITRSGT